MVRSILAVLLGWAAVGVMVVSTDGVLNKMYPDQYVHGKMPPDHLGQIQSWYQIGLILLWVPAVVIGGWLRAGKPDFKSA